MLIGSQSVAHRGIETAERTSSENVDASLTIGIRHLSGKCALLFIAVVSPGEPAFPETEIYLFRLLLSDSRRKGPAGIRRAARRAASARRWRAQIGDHFTAVPGFLVVRFLAPGFL